MRTFTACPGPERLQGLLDGTLPDAEQTDLTSHLNGCTACRQALEAMAGGESLSDVARNLQTVPPDEIPPQHVIEKIKESGSETVSQPGASRADDPSLGFLRPSANPDHLGRLGEFEILEVVGRGGMGIVFKAFDESLRRVVAVKAMAPQLATNAAARKRFQREATSAAAVSHDHIVSIHGVAEADGLPYLVMQFVAGESLQDRLDRVGPLDVKEILRIGLQTAWGLAAAHAQGLIHRDIKPANILLENGVARVKITDFGLARAVDDASVTQSGVIAGTPMYMSPEQAASEPVDHRGDLFSLGSVMYAMCTGHPPFRASGTMQVLLRVMSDMPRPIREINPDVPGWLCDIIAKLQAKKPGERFQSAKEVAELLEQHLAHLQQPSKVAMPARVEVPTAVIESIPRERTWKPILDATSRVKRSIQLFLLLVVGYVFLIFADSYRSGLFQPDNRNAKVSPEFLYAFFVIGFIAPVAAAVLIKHRWATEYKGRFLRFERSAIRGGKLFVDGELLARGSNELHTTIPSGSGAGDGIRVLTNAGVFSFRCRIDASEGPARPDEAKPQPPRGKSGSW